MRLLILTSRFPYPLEKGDKLRIFHQIRCLAPHADIYLISLTEGPVAPEDFAAVAAYCKEIHLLPLPALTLPARLYRTWTRGLPLQIAYFFTPRLKKDIQRLVGRIRPDRVYCQLIRMAEYARDLPYPKTLDLMDAFSVGAERLRQHSSGPRRRLLAREARLLRRYEHEAAAWFDDCTIISDQDRELMDLSPRVRPVVVPNGIDLDYFQPGSGPADTEVVFVGNMGYHPNVVAARYLVREVMPLVWATRPEVRVLLAGARPAAEVRQLASERVNVTGWLSDIRDAYGRGRVFAAPIFLGSGQQNKLLEAMAMQLPCITSTQVNNAIGATDGETILLADDAEAFARQISFLLRKPAVGEAMGRAARSFVGEHYTWPAAVRRLLALWGR